MIIITMIVIIINDENESREFLKKIWGINKVHNKDAKWLSNIKSEPLNLDGEEDIIVTKKDLKKMLQKLLHWKSPGKDELRRYWVKALNPSMTSF